MFSCKIYEIFKNTYFEEHLQMTASEYSFGITLRKKDITFLIFIGYISNGNDLLPNYNNDTPIARLPDFLKVVNF